MISEPIQVLLAVVERLDRLAVPYAVGGSLSSSVFGEPRASADVDLLVGLTPPQATPFVAMFLDDFYVDEDAVADAVRRHASFNVIHFATMLKADLFVAGAELLDQEQLRRRCAVTVVRDPPREAFVTAPENIVLRKLDWFREGNGVSDQQWRDVLGVIKAQKPTLDIAYLVGIAKTVGLDELVARALAEAGAG
ncbi:MAG TPA: hypothetical protein VMT03_23200 [Polyangia bacterium]|nr:hypothetical protein [Polyangia bacterium]